MIVSIPVLPGVHLSAVQTEKFKTGCFSVNLLRPLDRQEAALNALLPNVLLRGTVEHPTMQAISEHLDTLYGASMGPFVRKRGEVQTMGFFADFLADELTPGGEPVLRPMIDFAAEVLLRPVQKDGRLDEAFTQSEKANLINAIEANLNEKRSYAAWRLVHEMCAGEAYGVSRLGEAEDVRAITARSLTAHWQTVLETSRIEIFYLGAEAPETVAALFREALGPIPRGALCAPTTQVIREAGKPRYLTEALDVTQGKLCLGFRTGITAADPDYPALVLLNVIFGAGTTSKLFQNVREKRSLCYYVSSGVEKHKGLMTVSSGIEFDKYDEALAAILEQLELCRQGEITDAELEDARRQLDAALRLQEDAPGSLESFYLGQIIGGQEGTLEELRGQLAAVTKEQAVAAARKIRLDTVYFLKGVGA